MSNKIAIFNMTDGRIGGFYTFITHLFKGLEALDYQPLLLQIRKRTELKLRPFGYGLSYFNLSLEDAIGLEMPILIACSNYRKNTIAIEYLLSRGAVIVLHDPTEYTGKQNAGLIDCLRLYGNTVIVIRKTNKRLLEDTYGIKAHFIPHPYFRTNPERIDIYPSVAISRVDYDKYTHEIVEANLQLEPSNRIAIFGKINNLYAFHGKIAEHENWKERFYHGEFPKEFGAGSALAAKANYVVDMSRIKHDGGGTQYTTLEAWDAGVMPIIHTDWIAEESIMENGVNCVTVDNVSSLVQALCEKPSPVNFGASLVIHDALEVAKLYIDKIGN